MPVLERDIEAAVVKWWNNTGYPPSLKLNVMANRGWPDRIFPTPTTPTFIEFKRPGGKLSPLQIKVINDLERLGYYVYVLDDKEQAIRVLTAINAQGASGYHPAVMGASPVPEIRCGVAGWAERGGTVPGSGPGKNFNSPQDYIRAEVEGHNN